jgi:hypothetical protein
VGPFLAVLLQKRSGELRHALRGFGNRRIDIFQHRAAERLDLGLHLVGLGDSDCIGGIGEDHHAGLAAGIDEGKSEAALETSIASVVTFAKS